MDTPDFNTAIVVEQNPKQVFDAIANPRAWWSEEIEGKTDQLDSTFDYHYGDIHRCKIKITESIPNQRLVWTVIENYFKFTADKTEWTGTKIIFDLSEENGKTKLEMTHEGLVPQFECFEMCQEAWMNYIQNSLRSLIMTGKGMPNSTGKPQTESEKKLTDNKKP